MMEAALFRAQYTVAWPIWAGGYPDQQTALREFEKHQQALCDMLTQQLREMFGARSSIELRYELGAHSPIAGLWPQDYVPNSITLFVVAEVPQYDMGPSRELPAKVDVVVKEMADSVREFAREHMPEARQGADLYEITSSWHAGPAMNQILESGPLVDHNAPWILEKIRVDHNAPWILEKIRVEAERTKNLLRQLRHLIEQGQIAQPPARLVANLGLHAGVLARAIQQYTVRKERFTNGPVPDPEYKNIMAFVTDEARRDPALLTAPVMHLNGPDEYSIYRDELGFSQKEYDDLLAWKKAWDVHKFDADAAFETFSSSVVSELQAARYSVSAADIVPGVAGIVGIAIDVGFFGPTLAVPPLVASCATGLAAIAAKFPEVRKKLIGRGSD